MCYKVSYKIFLIFLSGLYIMELSPINDLFIGVNVAYDAVFTSRYIELAYPF